MQPIYAGSTQPALSYSAADRRACFDLFLRKFWGGEGAYEQYSTWMLAPQYAFWFAKDPADASTNLQLRLTAPAGLTSSQVIVGRAAQEFHRPDLRRRQFRQLGVVRLKRLIRQLVCRVPFGFLDCKLDKLAIFNASATIDPRERLDAKGRARFISRGREVDGVETRHTFFAAPDDLTVKPIARVQPVQQLRWPFAASQEPLYVKDKDVPDSVAILLARSPLIRDRGGGGSSSGISSSATCSSLSGGGSSAALGSTAA